MRRKQPNPSPPQKPGKRPAPPPNPPPAPRRYDDPKVEILMNRKKSDETISMARVRDVIQARYIAIQKGWDMWADATPDQREVAVTALRMTMEDLQWEYEDQ